MNPVGGTGEKFGRLRDKVGLAGKEQQIKNKAATEFAFINKNLKATFENKKVRYLHDTETLNKFIDKNRNELLEMVYYSKLVPGKWINKEKTDAKKNVTAAIIQEIEAYKGKEGSKTDASEDKSGSPEVKEGEGKDKEGEAESDDAGDGKGKDEAADGAGNDEAAGDGEGEDKNNPTTGGGGLNKPNNKIKTRKNKRYNNNNKKTRRNNT